MKLVELYPFDFHSVDWTEYDVLFFASGFEARGVHILSKVPPGALRRTVVLGFPSDREQHSREANDRFIEQIGLKVFVEESEEKYEELMKDVLTGALHKTDGPLRVFVDYSVMTRAWYGYFLTWLKYSGDARRAVVDWAYAHGDYQSDFDPLQIEEVTTIEGFEGGCAGARRTVAFYGLGYDKYATLAVHEIIEPDSVICYVAREDPNDPTSEHVLSQNKEILEMAGTPPVFVPLGNLGAAVRILHEHFSQVPQEDEILAVPMGPKPHVLATLMVAQMLEKVTCMHARGRRAKPVQVLATGKVSCWRSEYT